MSKHVTPIPLPKHKHDRFIALWIQDKKVENLLFECGKEAKDIVLKYFPDGVYWSMPPADAYHVTLFHFSQYEEPFVSNDDDEVLEWEIRESSEIWAATGTFTLIAHDVVLTKSGTLLVLWHAKEGNVDWLRGVFKTHFTNTPVGQTERILHSTLARFVVDKNSNDNDAYRLSSVKRDKLKNELQAVAAKITGTEVTIENLMYAGCDHYYDCSRLRFTVRRSTKI